MNITDKITIAKKAINEAEAIMITAGAGIGVDSGLPDFRGDEGFWKAYPPIKKLGHSFSDMANPLWFDKNPRLAWAFYGHRLNLYLQTIPHSGFSKLLEIVKQKNNNYFIYTSNVDGQFQKAGFEEDKIEECHGSIHYLQCSENCNNNIWTAINEFVKVDMDSFLADEPLPRCPNCGAIARPNILMFGDYGWISSRTNRQELFLAQWLDEVRGSKLVIIELGAGTAIPSVRRKSEHTASNLKATLIRINPRDFFVPDNQIALPYGAKEGIDKIID